MRKVGRGNWQWWQVAIGIGPLLALAGVAGADFARVKRVEQASHVMQLAGRIAHALQRMRGLTVGAALDANFSLDALPVQRRSVVALMMVRSLGCGSELPIPMPTCVRCFRPARFILQAHWKNAPRGHYASAEALMLPRLTVVSALNRKQRDDSRG